jgi:predicted phage tail protein
MKKFILHGDMSAEFCKEIKLNTSTMRETIDALSANFPDFRSYYINKSLKGIQYLFVDKNKNNMESYCVDLPLTESEYDIVPSMEGSAGFSPMAFLGNFALGYGMQWLSDKLGPQDDGTPEYEIITTNSFIYNRNENRAEQGTPVPIVYGQLRVGSKVIHSSIHNYDYNYDDGYIYEGAPSQTRLAKLYNNAQYNFISPAGMSDLRDGTEEAMKAFKTSEGDDSKRILPGGFSVGIEFHKKFHLKKENEAINESFNNADEGSNRKRHFGPSDQTPVYTEAGASWWDRTSLSPRPYVYPKSDSLDKNMRPESSLDLCVERESKAGSVPSAISDKSLSFKNPFTPTKIGNRGSYHKLESISIHNSLEVISEGPIAGFANPISGSDRDNGYINYPYGKVDYVLSEGAAKLGLLKYDKVTDKLISYDSDNSTVLITEKGADYPNGTYLLSGDGTEDPVTKIWIKAEKPTSLSSATIGDSSFLYPDNDGDNLPDNTVYHIDNVLTDFSKFYSNNKLFLLNSGDGSIHPNTNSNSSIDGFLDSKYLLSEATDQAGTTGVFQLSTLEDDAGILRQSFRIGKGYGTAAQSFSIDPASEQMEHKATLELLEPSDRVSQAACLDIGSFLSQRAASETIANEISDINGSSAATIPNTALSWDKMVRTYIEASVFGASTSITIKIGQWWNTGPNPDRFDDINLTITMEQYVTLPNVSATGTNAGAVASYTIWPSDTTDETNLFLSLATGTPQPLGKLLQNASFATAVFNAFNALASNDLSYDTMPAHTITRGGTDLVFGGGRYLKFTPGTGSTVAGGTNQAIWGNAFPAYMLTTANDNFTSAYMTSSGSIPEDDSSDIRGYYSPLLYPRVTVFVLRQSFFSAGTFQMSTYDFKPTKIDAVAQVDEMGLVEKIHLLRVPENPVWDGEGWTPILPQDKTKQKPFILNASSLNIITSDHGFYCKIDPSNEELSGDFIVNQGAITYPTSNGNHRHLCSVESEWDDHISKNGVSASSSSLGAGIFESSKSSALYNNNGSIIETTWQVKPGASLKAPTTPAIAKSFIESIDISNAATFKVTSIPNAVTQTSWNYICTGRPSSVAIVSSGVGYLAKRGNSNGTRNSFKVYNYQYGIKSIDIQQSGNKGYKPDQTFYAYGISKTKGQTSAGIEHAYFSTKLKLITDSRGKINSITILDPGFGFSSVLDPDDFLFAKDADATTEGLASARGFINGDESTFTDPSVHFLKQALILTADAAHMGLSLGREGSIGAFYVEQVGLGFNRNELVLNPFDEISYIAPVFDVTIAGTEVTSVTINSTHLSRGYSTLDSSIELSFSNPPLVSPPISTDPTADDAAWARSIYLNDVPIRDRNDRFNFSKFHFDMRIGHGKNGAGESNLILDQKDLIAPRAQPNMIGDEFKLPSYTKVVDFPLYGPRNEGEKDYYYTHTIRNPEVSAIHLSINMEKLHYTYEGDESSLYVNLIPLLMAGVAFMAAKAMKDAIVSALVQDPVAGGTTAKGTATGVCPGATISDVKTKGEFAGFTVVKTGELAKQAMMAGLAATILAGAAGLVLTYLLVNVFPCSKVQWLCFKIGEIIKNSGEIWPAKMRLAIEYGVEGGDMKTDVIAFRGCATNPYVKDILIDNLPKAEGSANNYLNRIVKVYRTTREVDPINGGITEARYDISAKLQSVTEYVEGFFGYPNTAIIGTRINSKDHPNQPVKEYLVKGRMIKVPGNYAPETGVYTSDWDGNWKFIDKNSDAIADPNEIVLEWTSNPAWIIYDLLTNQRYGMGKYGIKESDIDVWSFYTFSKFCDEKVDVVIDGVHTQERRHMCNLYVDQEREAYDYIKELLNIYNSSVNFSGGKIYITTDSSNEDTHGSVMIFTNANVEENSFEYSSTPETARITAASVDYLDERDSYMLKTEYVEDSEGMKEHGYSHAKIAGLGVTRRGEAHRLAWHKILTRQMEKELIKFKTGLQGSYLRIGDVIEVVDNNKIAKHSGGRIARIASANTIEIDIPASVIYPNNATLYIQKPTLSADPNADPVNSSEVVDRRKPQFEEYTISSVSGFNVTFTTSISADVVQGATWIIKENSSDKIKSKKYRIQEINESSSLVYEIMGIEYLQDKYDQIDSSTSSKDGIYVDEREYYGHTITL